MQPVSPDTSIKLCNNCNSSFQGNFCSNCGQKAEVGRLHLEDVFHDMWHSLTHTDKGILRLIKDLLFQPGVVYRNYFGGKRKTYFSPVLFLLVTAGLVGLLYPYVFDYENSVNHNNNEYGEALFHLAKFRSLILMPLMGIVTWLLFNKHYNIAETLSIWMFALGLTYVFRLVSIPVYFPLINHKFTIDRIVNGVSLLLILWQLLVVFAKSKPLNIVLCLLLIVLYNTADYMLQAYIIFDDKMWLRPEFSSVGEFLKSLFTF